MPPVNESEGHSPPPYVRVIYDETHRGKWYDKASIMSVANHINRYARYQGLFSVAYATEYQDRTALIYTLAWYPSAEHY
jgi:hypothetical protein